MCLLKLCSPALDSTADAMLRRIAQLERAVKAGIPSAAAPPASAAAEPPRADAAREVPADQSAPSPVPRPTTPTRRPRLGRTSRPRLLLRQSRRKRPSLWRRCKPRRKE